MTEKDDDVAKSLARSKKSFLSLIDIMGKEVLGLLMPGGGIVYEIGSVLFQHGKSFYQGLKEERILNFHRSLLENESKEGLEKFLEKPISLEDYYTLLSNALRDDEDAKVSIYSKLFKALINGKVPQNYKLHFIKSARELTCSDIELMRELYIINKYGRILNNPASMDKFTEDSDPIKNISIQTLTRLGFLMKIDISDSAQKNVGKKGIEPTRLIEVFLHSIFNPDELTPESIGKERLKGSLIYIAVRDINKHQDILFHLSEMLKKLRFKHVIVSPKSIKEEGFSLPMIYGTIILCLDQDDFHENTMPLFARHRIIREKRILKVLFEKGADGMPHDPLPEINAVEAFDLTSKDVRDIEKLERFMEHFE